MDNYKFNYTIIIPHKNIPNLLQRCLDSIPERNDLQIIVIDDNSDASKVDFNHFPGIERKNVEIYFTKEGKGAGYARNVGLKHAQGKWILFADADDYYEKKQLNIFLDESKDATCDIIYFNVLKIYSNGSMCPIQCRNNIYLNAIRTKKSWGIEGLRYNTWEPWTKMVRKSYIDKHQIVFQEISRRNDIAFGIKSNVLTNNFSIYDKIVYYYIQRSESISYRKETKQEFEDSVNICFAVNNLYSKYNINRRFSILYILRQAYKQYGIAEVVHLWKRIRQEHTNICSSIIFHFINRRRVKFQF